MSRWQPKRLAEARREKGLSKADLAKALGVSKSTVTQWEKGQTAPRGQRLVQLATLLGRSPEWFYAEEETKAAQETERRAVAAHANPPPSGVDLAEWERQARERLEALIQEMRRDWEERQRKSQQK